MSKRNKIIVTVVLGLVVALGIVALVFNIQLIIDPWQSFFPRYKRLIEQGAVAYADSVKNLYLPSIIKYLITMFFIVIVIAIIGYALFLLWRKQSSNK